MTLRSANRHDALACARIIRAWGAETPWMAPLDALEPMAASWRGLLDLDTAWVAESDGNVVGFCVREGDTVTGLYVERQARGRGVGKALLDLAKVNRDWITGWVYEKNTPARTFYRRQGLIDVGREKDEHSELVYIQCRWVRS